MPIVRRPRARRRQPREWGRLIALTLCVLFAIVGVIPLTLGLLVRTSPVRSWAASKTADIIERELGVTARYDVTVQAFPMMIGLENLVVDAEGGGEPFLQVERASVRPRPFSLLAGLLDVGDIEVVGARVRAVIKDQKLTNLRYRLPKTSSASSQEGEVPFSSIAFTDARFDVTVDDARVVTREVDLDLTVEEKSAFEVALRAGLTQITRVHPFPGREADEDSVDEDVICRLDARARVEPGEILIRRLTLQGSADLDPDPGTAPSCKLAPGDWREIDVRLGAVRVSGVPNGPYKASGRVRARLPIPIAHRFADVPYATGSLFLDGEVDYDGSPGLPRVTGTLDVDSPGVQGKLFAHRLKASLTTTPAVVRLSDVDVDWADGKVNIADVKLEPFTKGVPLTAGPIDIKGLEFPALMRDLGAHPQAHVAWSLYDGRVESFKGTLEPLSLEGPMVIRTRGFEVFDKPTTDPTRAHMMSVKEGVVQGLFQVKDRGVVLSHFTIDTPVSHLHTTVFLAFKAVLDLEIFPDTHIDLSELSPLSSLDIGGVAELKLTGHGPFTHPKIAGDLAVKAFSLAGLPAGDVESAKVAFEPLVLRLQDVRLRHNQSRAKIPNARIDFGAPGGVLVDADVDTTEAPHLAIRDFFEIFHFDKDPRFTEISGVASGLSTVHFALGGPEDRCGGGILTVRTAMRLSNVSLFGERYESGNLDLDYIWDDKEAGSNGMRLDLREGSLRKGSGSILATGSIRHGGALQISAIGSGIPVDHIDTLGSMGKLFDGTGSLVATVGGTLSQMSAIADVRLSRIRIGPSSLPSSYLRVAVEPTETAPRVLGLTHCGNARTEPFDKAEWDRDLPGGIYRANGDLFGGQVALNDVTVSRQQHKIVKGGVQIRGLELGTIANLIPGVAFASKAPTGSLTAKLDIERFPMDQPQKADVTLSLQGMEVERDGQRVRLTAPSGPISLINNGVDIPELSLEARTASGLSGVFKLTGDVKNVTTNPDIDVTLTVDPINLSKLASDIPALERANGIVDAKIHVTGPPTALAYSGQARLRRGELSIEGSPLALTDIDVDIDIGGGDVRIKKASARVGGGTVTATGRMPVRGLEVGTASASIEARGVKIPIADGINLTADADLEASYVPGAAGEGGRNLPDLKGTVALTSFSYTRPIALSVNLGQLTGRPQRTAVQSYDPDNDLLRFNLNVVSPKPLRFSNNLIDMQLEVTQPGIVLSGTNQRFGARGMLRVLPDSKLTLRSSEFDVREGYIRFDDPSRIAPTVDVRAQTEYRRYAKSGEATAAAATPEGGPASGGGAGATGSTAQNGGQWRINLHAHGDVDDLKVDLSSDPALGQEDIVLLLTIGLTRAELDRGLATSLGETVGLEALSALTGADKAVKTIVPLIDEFRFGTGYSSRTGRTEPTVTVGKRITDDVRASVTTGLTENRELRSIVEWKLGRRMSVQGSYDNANDASSSLLGNVGIDLRWRLEFE